MDNHAFSYASPGAIAELHLAVGRVGDIKTYFGVGGRSGQMSPDWSWTRAGQADAHLLHRRCGSAPGCLSTPTAAPR
jgi:hypothetical protein